MQKTFSFITSIVLALSVMLGLAPPVSGQACECFQGARIVPAGGQSKATTDAAYVDVVGDTMTGPLLLPDGISTAPSMGIASETGTGFYLAKVGRIGVAFDGVGLVTTFDATKGIDTTGSGTFGTDLAVNGNTILGDAFTDDLSIWPDQILFPGANDVNFNFASDVLFDGATLINFDMEVQVQSDIDAKAEVFVGDALHTTKGTDTASASTLVLLRDGNYFDVTGTTTINHVSKSGWFTGAVVVLQFDASLTVTHNAASPPINTLPILLQGGVDFVTAAGDTLTLVNDGVTFRELSRSLTVVVQDSIEIVFSGNTFSNFSTSNTTYTTAAAFRFGGTTARGTPTSVKFIGFKDATPTSWDARMFDVTNSQVIAEVTGSTGTASELVTDSTLTNLPTGEAIWEVQLKRTGGTGGSEAHANASSVVF